MNAFPPKSAHPGPKVDLHTHSTASDGLLSPTALVECAARAELRALALTDHDTAAGVPEAMAAGEIHGVEIVGGIELGVAAPWSPPGDPREIHVLGYFVDPASPALAQVTARMKRSRDERAPRIVEKLRAMGFAITMQDVREVAGGTVIGRPHLARALVARGHVATLDDAFDRYLGTHKPGYVDRDLLSVDEALSVIRAAGGLPVLAHPGLYSVRIDELAGWLPGLHEKGLVGLECGHPSHGRGLPRRLERLAAAHGLLVTAGSDYHGPGHKEGLRLGCSAPRRPIADTLYDALRERALGARARVATRSATPIHPA